MLRKLFSLLVFILSLSSCVTLPHSAHPLAANAIEKPIASREEKVAFLFPVTGGLALYDVDPLTGFHPSPSNSLAMRSYFGEAAIGVSRPFRQGSLAAIGGGLSAFGYSGQARGPEDAIMNNIDLNPSYSGFGGRLNLSLDLNYEIEKGMIAWRVLNLQYTYALESGRYPEYRQAIIDSNLSSSIDGEFLVVPGASDFRSTQIYTELAAQEGEMGLSFGLGLIGYNYEDRQGLWGPYQINGTIHLGLSYNRFYGRLNLGSIVPAAGTLPGPLSVNMMLGYRYRFK